MSKRTFKRSLALGALMAFIITGSAMAAELTIKYEEGTYTATGTGIATTVSATNTDSLYTSLKDVKWCQSKSSGIYNVNSISNNKLTIVNAHIDKKVYGGYDKTYTGDVKIDNNTVTLKEGTVVEGMVIAGYTNGLGGTTAVRNAEVTNNTLNVEGKAQVNSVFGAYAKGNSRNDSIVAKNNVVNICENAIVKGDVVGGSVGGKSVYGVYGAYAESYGNDNGVDKASATAILEDNSVNISGGTITGNVYGGYAIAKNGWGIADLDAQANGNKVNLSGGTVNGDVYGGYSIEITSNQGSIVETVASTASNNEVNISGTANVEDASLFGNNDDDGITGSTGNTLNIGDGWSGKIKSAQNFNIVNFGKGSAVTVTEGMKLGAGATINLADGDDYIGDGNWAIDGTLTVNSDEATLTIGNIKAATYNIASEYNDDTIWKLDNDLMNVKEWNTDGQLQVTVEAKSASDIATKLETSESTGSFVKDIIDGGNNEATEFLSNLMGSDITNEARNETLNAVQKMAEAGGNSATAANIVKNVTGVTNDRLSFNCGHSAPHKGGHGVGLFEEGSGADIWVEYVHGKDEVEDMPSTAGATSYEGQYNGIVMGVDFKKVGKFQSGIAFNYGEGDTNSVGSATRTHSDYDFWGVGYYGNIHNDDSNVIFDINYAQTDSDVTQSNPATTLEASPETTTWSAGVKLEKLYQNENVQIVPYTGLRYMSIDSDDYATKGKGFMYSMERQDIWLLPLGVSIKQEVVNDNGWTVSPRVDLSYIWAFGDTNSNMEVKSGNGITPIGYDVMDDGSFLGLVGIEAHKGQWGYGVAYSYQKGDHSESKKWYVDVNYSF